MTNLAKIESMSHIEREGQLFADLDDVIDNYAGLVSVVQVLGVIDLIREHLIKNQARRNPNDIQNT